MPRLAHPAAVDLADRRPEDRSEGGKELYYRYDAVRVSGSRAQIYLTTFPVLKHTRCGVWLDKGFGLKCFVNDAARKRFACPTTEEALESFRARKRRQIKILRERLEFAEQALQADPKDGFDLGFYL